MTWYKKYALLTILLVLLTSTYGFRMLSPMESGLNQSLPSELTEISLNQDSGGAVPVARETTGSTYVVYTWLTVKFRFDGVLQTQFVADPRMVQQSKHSDQTTRQIPRLDGPTLIHPFDYYW